MTHPSFRVRKNHLDGTLGGALDGTLDGTSVPRSCGRESGLRGAIGERRGLTEGRGRQAGMFPSVWNWLGRVTRKLRRGLSNKLIVELEAGRTRPESKKPSWPISTLSRTHSLCEFVSDSLFVGLSGPLGIRGSWEGRAGPTTWSDRPEGGTGCELLYDCSCGRQRR